MMLPPLRLLLSALALAPLAAPALAQCGQDTFEPNNSCAAPHTIGTPFVQTGLAVYRLTDEDYYRVTVPANQVLDVNVLFSDAAGDIDVFLYDANSTSCGSPFNYLVSSVTTNDDERILWTNLSSSATDVIIKVLVFPGSSAACNTYDMTVTAAPPVNPCDPALSDDTLENNDSCAQAVPLPLGLTTNLWVSRTDSDFYSITLDAGRALDVQAYFVDSISDVDLFLYRASGPCGGGFQSGELASGFTQTDNERIIWSNNTGAPIDLVLEVDVFDIDDCNSYSLEVAIGGGGIGSNYCQAAANTTGQLGLIRATGSQVVGDNNVTLHATQLPRGEFGMFVVSATQGFVANPGGSAGNLCLIGTIGRFHDSLASSNQAGVIDFAVDLTAIAQPHAPVAAAAGDTWYFQLWHRDTDPTGSNFTNGLAITFQ